MSQIAYKGKRLSNPEKDAVFLDLAKSLLEENLCEFASNILKNVNDQTSFEFLSCKGQMLMISKQFDQAVAIYQSLLEQNARWIYGYEQIGHAFFKLGQEPQAMQIYLKALRVANLTNQQIAD